MKQTVLETSTGWQIKCPACQWHEFPKKPLSNGAKWQFDGNMESPTFTPSMNQTLTPTLPEIPMIRCHFIITKGVINFCKDCTHELAGKSMPLECWDDVQIKMSKCDLDSTKTDL